MTYSNEENFIRIIADYFGGRSCFEATVDYDAVMNIAKKQEMLPLVFCAIKDFDEIKALPDYKKWQTLFYQYVMRNEVQLAETKKLTEYLCANGVTIMPLKGTEIKKLYPSPILRTMCDVDLYYEGVSTKQLAKLMTDFGYEEESVDTGAHDVFTKKPHINVELHRQLVVDDSPYNACIQCVTENKVADSERENLYHYRHEDLYIHVLVHAAKHFYGSGLGVRPLCDVYWINKAYAQEWDTTYIREQLAKGKLERFEENLRKLANKWFGEGKLDFSREEEAFFFAGGTYGDGREFTSWMYSVSEKKNGASFFLSRVFKPYATMCSAFPILKKYPILLPVFWVYHWFEVLLCRRYRLKAVAAATRVSEEQRAKAQRILHNLGLDE